jgi:hypothetical protein
LPLLIFLFALPNLDRVSQQQIFTLIIQRDKEDGDLYILDVKFIWFSLKTNRFASCFVLVLVPLLTSPDLGVLVVD